MVKFILIKSPDEWATTKQACRDELGVYLFFSPIYSSLYFYVLSTVLRTSSFTLYIYIYIYKLSQASKVCRCFPHKTIYQTQMKIRPIFKTTYISTNLSVFLRVSEENALHTRLLRLKKVFLMHRPLGSDVFVLWLRLLSRGQLILRSF